VGVRNLVGEQFDDLVGFVGRGRQPQCLVGIALPCRVFLDPLHHAVVARRALIKNAPIILLDEPTAALDSESERQVQEALAELRKGRTTLVIAHRLSTITHADNILVVEAGQVVESGRHEELLRKGGRYASFYRLQLNEQGPSLESLAVGCCYPRHNDHRVLPMRADTKGR
jgi:hypothetical protein